MSSLYIHEQPLLALEHHWQISFIKEKAMSISVLSAFLVFTFITAITPGPNNILALTTGSRAGFRGSIPVLAGICGGFLCVMAICGVLSYSFSSLSATYLQIMRYAGCAYLLWLAWKIAMPNESGSSGHTVSGFVSGFVQCHGCGFLVGNLPDAAPLYDFPAG